MTPRLWKQAGAVLVVLAGTPAPSAAAVRHCLPPVIGIGSDQASEAQARRMALEAWRNSVRTRHGVRWESWRLATPRSIRCVRGPDGGHRCEAAASPCAISQSPDRVPSTQPGREI